MVAFEHRSYLSPNDVRKAIQDARVAYVAELERLAEEARSWGKVGSEAQDSIEWLLQKWASASRLLEIY